MAAIFVAYGERDRRTDILEFAVEQAASCGHDLVVYHIQEARSESVGEIREEIETVVQQVDPYLVYDIEIVRLDGEFGKTGESKQEHLLRAIFETDREYAYVVMGKIDRGPIAEITHSSMTKAVLNEHSIPVLLVPI